MEPNLLAAPVNRIRPGLSAVALVAVSSAAFILSFPPYRFPLLPWLALVPLFVALHLARTTASAAALAALWGLLSAYGITAWLPRAIANYYQQPFLLGLGLFVATSAVMGASQYALFAAACHRVARLRPPSPFFVAAAWVAAELGRCRLFGGNPWGLVGYTLAGAHPGESSPQLMEWLLRLPVQVADLGGVYAVSFVVVAWNAAFANVLVALWRRRSTQTLDSSDAIRRMVAAAALVAIAAGYGHYRLAQLAASVTAPVEVAIVQGNVNLGATWRAELYGRNFDVYLKGTLDALRQSPSLVVWPENSMSFFVEDEPLYRKAIERALAPSGAQLIAGGPSHTAPSPPEYFNSAYLFSPQGNIVARYDKEKLLPFAERFPFGAITFLRRSFGKVREFTPGVRLAPLPSVAGRAGVLICNEIMFAELPVARVRDGAQFLVNLSNDTWIGDDVYSLNHLAIGAIRAIETRRVLVRASTSGPSAFVDAMGRVFASSLSDRSTVLTSGVTPSSVVTPYVRFGDLFAFACLAIVALRALTIGRAAVTP